MIFKKMFLRVKRQIMNSPLLGVSVMLHQNSFRVDTVLDGFGIEDSLCFWRNGQFNIDMNCQTKRCLRCSRSAAAPWEGFTTGVGIVNRWTIKDWTTGGLKMFDSTLHLARFVDYMYDLNFSLEIWWFNSYEGLYFAVWHFDFNPVCYGRCQLEGFFVFYFKSLMCS